MSIYTELKAAGIKLDSHESDLYAEVTPESASIVEASNVRYTMFTSEGNVWYDIPFAYDPFWEGRETA